MEMLLKAFTNAEEVVDYITAHPHLAALRSGKNKVILEDSMKSIDSMSGSAYSTSYPIQAVKSLISLEISKLTSKLFPMNSVRN
jgi:hypothetical protein